MFAPSQNDVRQFFCETLRKQQAHTPLTPMESAAADWIAEHPEYHPELADLPKASSLCGACNEVCPVNIPIPDLLLRLREKGKREGAPLAAVGTPPMGAWAVLATQPSAWKVALFGGKIIDYLPTKLLPIPPLRAWEDKRTLPKWRGGEFRSWMKNRAKLETTKPTKL